MKQFRLEDLLDAREGHFLSGILPGDFISTGQIVYKKPGERSHDVGCKCTNCDGKGRHAHQDSEVFIILQGKAVMQLNEKEFSLNCGDIFVCEPGEDHHLVADKEDPCVSIYMHLGSERNEEQSK